MYTHDKLNASLKAYLNVPEMHKSFVASLATDFCPHKPQTPVRIFGSPKP